MTVRYCNKFEDSNSGTFFLVFLKQCLVYGFLFAVTEFQQLGNFKGTSHWVNFTKFLLYFQKKAAFQLISRGSNCGLMQILGVKSASPEGGTGNRTQ